MKQKTEMGKLFAELDAKKFFPTYLPHINNWSHKLRGKSGRGQPLEFSEEEVNQIKKAIKKFARGL